jgi:hypothetical protein
MAANIETRVEALEAEVARLKAKMDKEESKEEPWWRQIAGTFEGDPYYKEAMELGRKYRESLRPKPSKKKKKKKK